MNKRISLITICYNSAATLPRTLKSVAQQSYKNVEYIVVDGNSKDQTLEIIKTHQHLIAKWVSEPDKGIYDAINKGLSMATGDIIGLLHADDEFAYTDALKDIASAFATEPQLEVFYADLEYQRFDDEKAHVTRHWKAGRYKPNAFLWGWMPPHPTFYISASYLNKLGEYNTQFRLAGDYEFMLRAFHLFKPKFYYHQKVLVKMTVGGASNASLKNRLKANKEDTLAWKINGIKPYFFTLWLKPLRKIGQFFA